jgi:hypothetical protein
VVERDDVVIVVSSDSNKLEGEEQANASMWLLGILQKYIGDNRHLIAHHTNAGDYYIL